MNKVNAFGMAAVSETHSSSSSLSSSGSSSSHKQSMEGGGELPHLKPLRVGGGLCVAIQTTGSPTPACVTDSLRSHSTKHIVECQERLSHRVRFRSARLAKSTSQLVSESRMLPISERVRYLHGPIKLSTFQERKSLKVSGMSWSPMASLDVRENSPGSKSSCASQEQEEVTTAEGGNEVTKHRSPSKPHPHKRSYSFNCGRGETTSLLSREQAQPTHRRRILTDYEKDLTFKPKLNNYSLKMASRNARLSLPLVHRLSEVRRNESLPRYDQEHLTFAPKLNPLSLKLANERALKMPEVQAKQAQQNAARLAEANSACTFKPQVLDKSQRIVQGLGTDFLTRQQKHLAKKGKLDKVASDKSPTRPQQGHTSKRLIKLTSRALPVAKQPSPHEADSAKAASCSTSPRRSSLTDGSRANSEEAGGGVASKEASQTTPTLNADTTRPASCTPPQRTEQKLRKDKSSPNVRTPPQVSKCSRSKHTRSRTTSAEGENGGTGSSLKKMTGAAGRDSIQTKKIEALLSAKFVSLNDTDRVKRIRINSEKFVKSKKVFLIRGGYRRIRKCLRQRGWVELEYCKNSQLTNKSSNEGGSPKKGVEISRLRGGESSDDDSDGDADDNDGGAVSEEEYSDEEEYTMLSRALRNHVPNFVWTLKREGVLFRSLNRDSIANHFAKASSFTTKVGLCTNLRNLLWFGDTDPDTFFPRCYRLSCDEEKEAFIEDYRFTAALCILKMLSQRSSRPHPCVGNSLPVESSQPTAVAAGDLEGEEAAQLAMKAAEAFLGSQEHSDIEGSQYQLCPKLTDLEWEKLIHHFYCLAFENGQLNSSMYTNNKASDLLDKVEQHYPQLHMDGSRNVWIIKPGALSRGRGIMCMDRLKPILELVSSTVVKNEGKWIIQKYIERPLLLFDTKFDIRQWFLVTDWNPLTMWMYKESYLRFSTQRYTLEDLDQSIHLCNNSIQKHYNNSEMRADALPDENMWDSNTFQDYLSGIGHPNLWTERIYPGMKQALIHVLQVTQDEIEHRKNSFELYGADFMISSDYNPWLIEINCSPTMQSSTTVTTRLCRQVMEDTLKVVLDRREDKDCDTGGFELAYKQPRHEVPSYVGVQLCVQGYTIPKPRSYTYIRKSVLNASDSANMEVSAAVKQDTRDGSNSKTLGTGQSGSVSTKQNGSVSTEQSRAVGTEQSSADHSEHRRVADHHDPRLDGGETVVCFKPKTDSSSNSTAVSTPTATVKTGQTGLACGSRPHPTSLNIVEINCRLPNTNLRVS